jgi:hypothetical protein
LPHPASILGGPISDKGIASPLRRLFSLCPGLNQVAEGQLSVNADELRVVGGFGRIHLLCWQLLPRENQRLGVGELPDEPPVPMANGLPAAEVGELLNALSQSAVAGAARTGFSDVEDVCVLDPLRLQDALKQGRIPPLEAASNAFRKERSRSKPSGLSTA